LVAIQDTYLKKTRQEAETLPDEQKQEVRWGEQVPVSSLMIERDGHAKITLKDSKDSSDHWWIQVSHFLFPEVIKNQE